MMSHVLIDHDIKRYHHLSSCHHLSTCQTRHHHSTCASLDESRAIDMKHMKQTFTWNTWNKLSQVSGGRCAVTMRVRWGARGGGQYRLKGWGSWQGHTDISTRSYRYIHHVCTWYGYIDLKIRELQAYIRMAMIYPNGYRLGYIGMAMHLQNRYSIRTFATHFKL